MNHNQNNIYKTLSQDVYKPTSGKLPTNWVNLSQFETHNLETGFDARVYQNIKTKELIFSFRGSLEPVDFLRSDQQMLRSKIPIQYYDAKKLYATVTKQYSNSKITFTGHSLGGSISQLMSKSTGNPTFTFSPYGTGTIIQKNSDIFSKNSQITNYGVLGDDIFSANLINQPGNTYIFEQLKPRSLVGKVNDPFGSYYGGFAKSAQSIKSGLKEQHILENYPDLNQAKPYNPQTQYVDWDGKIQKIPTNFQNYLRDFSRLQPAKISDEINQPLVKGVSGGIDNSSSNLIVHNPLPKTSGGSWLGQLGQALSLGASAIQLGVGAAGALNGGFATKSVSAKIVGQYHTGGKVSGRDEVMAILRGGETVSTEAQENELQKEKKAQFMEAIRPLLEEKNKPKTIADAYDPDNKIPCLLNKTTADEELIISIIAGAWKSNRLGFRNVLRYE
jgi:hypothetical protein